MKCKCTHPRLIFEGDVDEVVLIFFDDRFYNHTIKTISQLDFQFSSDEDIIRFKLKEPALDIVRLCESLGFNEAVMGSIKALIRNSNNPLTLKELRNALTLEEVYTYANSSPIIEIILKNSITHYFQPIIELNSNKIYGYELLMRGLAEDGSIISPAKLLDVAKRADLIFYLDRISREKAIALAAEKKVNKKVFINFLPTAIYDPQFCLNTTLAIAEKFEFDPQNLIFEVVETEKVTNIEHLKNIIDYYKVKGFKVALDDLGSGYSSINLLLSLRPDIIKIDREIVRNIHLDSLKQSVVKAILLIAKENGIIVLAEGVETQPEAEWLAQNSVDLAQGYLFGKPSPNPLN